MSESECVSRPVPVVRRLTIWLRRVSVRENGAYARVRLGRQTLGAAVGALLLEGTVEPARVRRVMGLETHSGSMPWPACTSLFASPQMKL